MGKVGTRIRSLDIFRGLTVALMILVNNPGTWAHVYAPFLHAEWHGLTPTDLVFPFFLFAVGNALALTAPTPVKILKRTALIFLIGLLLNWSPFLVWRGDELILKTWTWTDASGQLIGVRIMGVLQRIALAYGLAAFLVNWRPRQALPIAFVILILSAVAAFWFGDWTRDGFYGTALDRALLGDPHLYHGEGVAFDPEGLMSTWSAIPQVLIGYWVSLRLKDCAESTTKKSRFLLAAALALLVAGYAGSLFQPINKKIWTSSYTLVTSGYAVLTLLLIDRTYLTWDKVAQGFEVFGRNPLFIYVLSGFLPRGLALVRLEGGLTPLKWFYEKFCAVFVPGPPENGSLVYAGALVFFYWAVARELDRRRIYIRV